MFQSFTKIFSKPKPEFSRSKILSFIENYDYLKGRKDPGATGLITVLSKSECRVNLKNDVDIPTMTTLLALIRSMNVLSMEIQNREQIKDWVRNHYKNGSVVSDRDDPLTETYQAIQIEKESGVFFSKSEHTLMMEYYQNVLFDLLRKRVSTMGDSIIYIINKCVTALSTLGYVFLDEEIKEILHELEKHKEDEVVFRSTSLRDRSLRFDASRESQDAYEAIVILNQNLGIEYYRKYIDRAYSMKHFYSLEKTILEQQRKQKQLVLGDIFLAARYRQYQQVRTDDEMLVDLYTFYDNKTGGFEFYSKKSKMPERGEGEKRSDIQYTFTALEILSDLSYQFQS